MTLSGSNAHKTERSHSPAPVSSDQEPSLDCGSGTINSYWNKIKMLHAQARLISDRNNIGENLKSRGGRSCSIFSKAHNVFEVPEATVKHEVRRRHEKWNSLADTILTKPESVFEGMIESPLKHDADKQRGTVTSVGMIRWEN
ncbi:unnamed protein product [Vicia faba]|uniref:Uncharacterized protein n=1 Tax=Vicia faba TaxID=3906 RepID=A0AAV0YTS9_VICFA|nr:unnamed protein product [Vicia faba]